MIPAVRKVLQVHPAAVLQVLHLQAAVGAAVPALVPGQVQAHQAGADRVPPGHHPAARPAVAAHPVAAVLRHPQALLTDRTCRVAAVSSDSPGEDWCCTRSAVVRMTEMMIPRMMTLLMMIPQAPTARPAAVLPVAAVLQDLPLQAGAGAAVPVLVRDPAQVHQAGAVQAHRAAAPLHLPLTQVLLMMTLQAPEAVIPMVTN